METTEGSRGGGEGLESLTLRITKVIYQNPQNGYAIVSGQDSERKRPATAAGNLGPVSRGQTLEMSGHWTDNPKYGRQFRTMSVAGKPPGPSEELAALADSAGLSPTLQGILAALPDWLSSRALGNPYRLVGEASLEWPDIDRLGRAKGIPPDSIRRIESCLRYVLLDMPGPCRDAGAASANCHLPVSLAIAQAGKLLSMEPPILASHLTEAEPSDLVCLEHNGAPIVMESSMAYAESTIVRRVQELRALTDPAPWGKFSDIGLSNEQERAAMGVLACGISALSGPPGVGKTRTIASVVALLMDMGHSVSVCAYTGKAADRLNQVIGGAIASTIHRLLECKPSQGSFQFLRGPGNPLSSDYIIVDESSMVSLDLMADLLSAMKPGARIILVGDENQIPPVAPGQPFADMIASGAIPVFRLRHIFRQAAGSAIAEACHVLLEGNPARFFEFLRSPESQSEITWIPTPNDGAIVTAIQGYMDMDMQILSPVRQGSGGTMTLNQFAKDMKNPGGKIQLADGLHAGVRDPVIWIRNDYERKVFNGDSFRIESGGPRNGISLRPASGYPIPLLQSETRKWLAMSYALTIHKSQGSEWPTVLLAIPGSATGFLTRSLLYTGMSRAKGRLVMIGSPNAIRVAMEASGIQVHTRLLGLLSAIAPAA